MNSKKYIFYEDIACPHFSNIGGSLGCEISLETGQKKSEWNLKSLPISISIGSSFLVLSSSLFYNIAENFKNWGRERVPAVMAKYNELSGGISNIL